MTKRIGNVVILANEAPDVCALCGKHDELRPYGPKGARVCYDCMKKDEPNAKAWMNYHFFGGPRPE